MTDKKLLGPKTFWWKVRIFLFTPVWFCRPIELRKTWLEFKYGLINHKCVFDGKIEEYKGIRFQSCSHFGCNIVHDIDLDNELP